jgi:hypothetical protein
MAARTDAALAEPVTRTIFVIRSTLRLRTPTTSLTRALITRTQRREYIAGTWNKMVATGPHLRRPPSRRVIAVPTNLGDAPVEPLTNRCP